MEAEIPFSAFSRCFLSDVNADASPSPPLRRCRDACGVCLILTVTDVNFREIWPELRFWVEL